MGQAIRFNWVLQTDAPDMPKAGGVYEFSKPGNRVFPLNTPIDLIDPDRVAIAKIRITSFSNDKDSTTGVYKIVKIYEVKLSPAGGRVSIPRQRTCWTPRVSGKCG